MKTLKKYCTIEKFINEDKTYKVFNFEILLLEETIKNSFNLYGDLFEILCKEMSIKDNSYTKEIILLSDIEHKVLDNSFSSNKYLKNCILISYNLIDKKIVFLEKSRGNIVKKYLLSYLTRLQNSLI